MYKVYKCILLGDSGVGKSTLLHHDTITKPTVGVDFRFIECPHKDVKVMIWDTAGIEKFRSIIQNYYTGTKIGIFVYDVSNRASFLNVKRWFEHYNARAKPAHCLLVANKCDVPHRCITTDEGMALASTLDMTYMERCKGDRAIFTWIVSMVTEEEKDKKEEEKTCFSTWMIKI